MADNFDAPSFSIENTMDMGMGNAELINDLFSPETTTGDSDNLEPIVKTVNDPAPTPAPTTKVKTVDPPKTDDKDDDQDKKLDLEKFLLGDDDDDSDDNNSSAGKEPVTKVDKKDDSDSSDDGDDEGDITENRFEALANDLFNLGVFTKDEDEDDVAIKSPEEFLERFQNEKKKGAIEAVNNFIGQFGEDYQQAFDAIYVKGVDPKEYFGTYNNIQSFAELDLSQENNQVTVIKQALADQGFDPEDIETEVERLRNYGDLETVASRHHKVLIKKEAKKLEQLEQDAERKLQQKQAIKNQYVQNVNTILQEKIKEKEFDGIPLNPKIASELQDFLLVDKYKTASGETLTDFDRTILDLKRPENHAMKVKVALLLKVLEKDPTLSTIQKTGVTKKSNSLFSQVARQVEKSSVKGNKSDSKPSSWFV